MMSPRVGIVSGLALVATLVAALVGLAPRVVAGVAATAGHSQPAPRARTPAVNPAPGTGGDAPAPTLAGEQRLSHGRFGEVMVYRPAGKPSSVALFISGDGGWNLGVVDMARHLLSMNAAVVGIDIRRYLKAVNRPGESCQYFGADFEGLSHDVQQRLRLDDYLPPVLIGYSSGATLAYAVLVQSPKGTFVSAMSLGFCPDLDVTQKICKGSGLDYQVHYGKPQAGAAAAAPVQGVLFSPARSNVTPWVAFQGDIDQVCDPAGTRKFVAATGSAELVWLPKVGHGFSVERNWLPQFKAAYAKLAARAAPPRVSVPAVADLPLVEVPATAAPQAQERELFAVLLTGDGGWAGIDQDVAAALAAHGIPVIGLDTLKYFWHERTPETAAADLERIVQRYAIEWQRRQVLLVGYSFGADVLPFLYTRLAADVRRQVRTVNLLGLSDTAAFEFHVSDWVPGAGGAGRPTAPEIRRMQDASVLCVYGESESDSPCPRLTGAHLRAVALGGGHHFGGDYEALARSIVEYGRR